MIKVKNLSVGYNQTSIIQNVNFEIKEGQILALIGPNGSGKSSILKTIAGLLKPIDGEIKIESNQKIAYLGQFNEFNLALPLSVFDFVMTGQYSKLGLFGKIKDANKNAVKAAMEFMEIYDLAPKPLASLSGGQKQRAMLACIMAKNSDVILLDEPANNLDAKGLKSYENLIDKFKSDGATIIISTHNLQEAKTADYVAVLANNQITAFGEPNETLKPEVLLKAFGIN